MKLKAIKNLVRKLGGDPTGAKDVAEALDRLCGCEVGGASSWNDLTDKPFGEETEKTVAATTEDRNAGSIFYVFMERSTPVLIDVDGVEYTVMPKARDYCVDNSGIGVWGFYVGNPALFNDGAGFPEGGYDAEDYPFLIYAEKFDQMYEGQENLYTYGLKTASVYRVATTTKTLDAKYLPASTGGGGTQPVLVRDDITTESFIELAKAMTPLVRYSQWEDTAMADSGVYKGYNVRNMLYYTLRREKDACGDFWDVFSVTACFRAELNVGGTYISPIEIRRTISEEQYNEIAAAWEAMVG